MIATETHDDTTVLRFEHGKANALDLELLRALDAQLEEFAAGKARALVLTGQGSMFCAGVDLPRLLEGGQSYVGTFLEALTQAIRRLYTVPKPVVAAVNGHAIAGGCLLAAACDHAIMAEGKGRIGVTELLVGVPFPVLGLEILRAAVGAGVAQSLAFSGRLCDAEEARRIGLVQDVVAESELLPAALDAARRLGGIPSDTFAITKRQLCHPVLDLADVELAELEIPVRDLWRSEDAREAISAFVERNLGSN